MKATVYTATAQKKGTAELPKQFTEPLRPDIVRRVFLAMEASARQQYGSDPKAGLKHAADLSRRRRKYRGSYGFGISRVPRKILSRRGTRMNWVGAESPGTVGGRRAHHPKAEKIWAQKINKKEKQLAIRAAIAATVSKEAVAERGHKVPADFPLAISDDFEKLSKTANVIEALEKMGLKDELTRAAKKTIRAGRGTMRGRKYRKKVGPLLVVSGKCDLQKAAQGVPGVSCVRVDSLNVRALAPGGHQGRLTIFTQSALERMTKEKLYTDEFVASKVDKKEKKPEPKKTAPVAKPGPVIKKTASKKKVATKKE